MKTSGLLFGVTVVGVLALQGCTTAAGVQNAQVPTAVAAPQTTAAASHASAAAGPAVKGISTKSDFEAVQAAINQQMQPGGRFSSVDPTGRATVNGRFQDMAALFEQYGSVDKMNPAAMARLDSDQNAINGVLASRDGNRLICHDETPVGSHLPKRVCRTLSEIQNQQNNAQQMMRQNSMRQSQIGGH